MSVLEQVVPEGYKQTDVGIIPEDWESINFGDLFEQTVSRKQTKLNETVTFIGMQDVSESAQLISPKNKIYEQVKTGFTYFERNDVLVAKITPCFENGKGCYTSELQAEKGFGSTEFHVLRAKGNSDSKFIYFWTTRNSLRQDLEGEMVGSAGHRRVPFAALQNYRIPCPNNSVEQTVIANALSDVDALLTELENLIVKKQAIKTASMQQLLTGKTRLPQFATYTEGEKQDQLKGTKTSELGEIPDGWEVNKLGGLGKFKNGINKDADSFGHGSPFINLMDVFGKPQIKGNENFGLINSTPLEKKEYGVLEGDVMFIRSSVKPSGVGLTSVAKSTLKQVVYSGFLIRFRSNKTLDNEFKVHCFYEENFRKRIVAASTVSANTNINQEALKDIQIAYPSDIEEQNAIATILSDMDNEIQTLEQRLMKTRQIKQGMMQQLLTGRTRLPY